MDFFIFLYSLPNYILIIVAIVLGIKLVKLTDLKIKEQTAKNTPPPQAPRGHAETDQVTDQSEDFSEFKEWEDGYQEDEQ